LRGITAIGVDFSELRCWALTCENSTFESCRFDHLQIEHGTLATPPIGTYRDCTFDEARFTKSFPPGYALFERCSFNGAHIEEWFAWCAQFIDCTFADAEIVRCKFSAHPLDCFGLLDFRHRRRRNEFRGNDFSRARLLDTSFVGGIDLDEQRLPDTPDYLRINDARVAIERARDKVAGWSNEDQKRHVIAALDALAFDAEEQRDLFVRRDFFELPAGVRDELWDRVRGD